MSHPDNTVPKTMSAMVLNGNGGMDMYEWRTDWPTPTPDADDVLIRVAACGLNNTDVNTRSGWYSKGVSEATTGVHTTPYQTRIQHGVVARLRSHAFKALIFAVALLPWAQMLIPPASANV